MIAQREVVTALIINFSLLVLFVGVIWSPAAALNCARAAGSTGGTSADMLNGVAP